MLRGMRACFYRKLPVQNSSRRSVALGHLCKSKEHAAVLYSLYFGLYRHDSNHSPLDTAACTTRFVVQPYCVVLGVDDFALACNEAFEYIDASLVPNAFPVM